MTHSVQLVPRGWFACFDYEGPLDDPKCTLDDVEYVLRAVNAWKFQPARIAGQPVTAVVPLTIAFETN